MGLITQPQHGLGGREVVKDAGSSLHSRRCWLSLSWQSEEGLVPGVGEGRVQWGWRGVRGRRNGESWNTDSE